ncbi:hypothetical protein AVDCRST_MAG81-2428 [uncultured Synechococcales cyanobacterium]|uniref:Uncharacterized protein n=1 Tax=uncultured Synechococcales cyanobacterium TaxID=1936017 RepID=A0A6J4VEH1_9CYAN|nr:hypothetical protein AVDCRST_MAG81-2428 [uncultured Synechococcales cyanobacterium]
MILSSILYSLSLHLTVKSRIFDFLNFANFYLELCFSTGIPQGFPNYCQGFPQKQKGFPQATTLRSGFATLLGMFRLWRDFSQKSKRYIKLYVQNDSKPAKFFI